MLNQPSQSVSQTNPLPVILNDPPPAWQELPPECQRELVLALASLLLSQPEVNHERRT
jgi:hypothetical protein